MPRVAPDSNDIVVWLLNESGTPFVNSSSAGSPGTSANLTTLQQGTFLGEPDPKLQQQGPFGSGSLCPEFQGSQSGRWYIGGANGFQPQPPLTFSMWLMMRRWDQGLTQHFFNKQHTINVWSGSTFADLTIQNRGYAGLQNGELDFGVGTAGNPGVGFSTDRTQPYPLGVWNHIGYSFDGRFLRAYINGDLVGVTDNGTTISIVYDTSVNSGPWFFGAIPAGSGSVEESYNQIADVRIANVVRNQAYFQNIYAQGQLDFTGNATNTAITRTRYYKLRASCSTSPSGFITWVNTTGDNTGQPGCSGTLGPTIIVDTWVQ